jgi:hypothetical protein
VCKTKNECSFLMAEQNVKHPGCAKRR